MKLVRDDKGVVIQAFSPKKGKVITSGTYVPSNTETAILGNAVDITIDDTVVSYPSGTVVILVKGIQYTFGSDTPVHLM